MPETIALVTSLLALMAALLALALATVANRRLARRSPRRAPSGTDVGGQVGARDARRPGPSPEVDATALRHVAVVRYDAFADVGGRLSYSVAILDDTASGLVLTTLAGKADVRTYVRAISAGSGDGSLTAEEQQAIDAAVGSRP